MKHALGTTDLIGIIASSLTLSASAMLRMLALRAFNMIRNFAFIIHGIYLGTMLMIILHSILLPSNTCHLYLKLKANTDADIQDYMVVASGVEKILYFEGR